MLGLFNKSKGGQQKNVLNRDFIVVTVSSKTIYSFHSNVEKKLMGGVSRALVEFANLPKLDNKLKDPQKLLIVLQCKIQQCCYICPEELLQSPEAKDGFMDAGGEEGGNPAAAALKKQRKTQKTNELQDLKELTLAGDMKVDDKKQPKNLYALKKKARKTKKAITAKEPELRAMYAKTETLYELQEFIVLSNYQPRFEDETIKQLVEMIAANLFVPFPPANSFPMPRAKAASARSIVDPIDILHPSWTHRSLIHRIFGLLVTCCKGGGKLEGKTINGENKYTLPAHTLKFKDCLQKLLTPRFMGQYVRLLQSPDEVEREFVQAQIQHMYICLDEEIRITIRNALLHVLYGFFSERDVQVPFRAGTQIKSLLNLFPSILPTMGSEESVCEKYVLPLYRANINCVVRYHQELFKVITLLVSRSHKCAVLVVKSLLRSWPKQSAFKQLLYIDQVHGLFLQLVERRDANDDKKKKTKEPKPVILPHNQWYYQDEDRSALGPFMEPLFQQICNCISENHYDVSQAAVKIVDHPAVFFPYVLFPPLPESGELKRNGEDQGDYERRVNPLLSYVYKAFRATVATHAYIEVRKTMDTLMGLMENKWGALCQRCIEEEHEAARKEQEKQKIRSEILALQVAHSVEDVQVAEEQVYEEAESLMEVQLGLVSNAGDFDIRQQKASRAMSILTTKKKPDKKSRTTVVFKDGEEGNGNGNGSTSSTDDLKRTFSWNTIQERRKRTWSKWEESPEVSPAANANGANGADKKTRAGTYPFPIGSKPPKPPGPHKHKRKNSLDELDKSLSDREITQHHDRRVSNAAAFRKEEKAEEEHDGGGEGDSSSSTILAGKDVSASVGDQAVVLFDKAVAEEDDDDKEEKDNEPEPLIVIDLGVDEEDEDGDDDVSKRVDDAIFQAQHESNVPQGRSRAHQSVTQMNFGEGEGGGGGDGEWSNGPSSRPMGRSVAFATLVSYNNQPS